jgi:hypothetical protein
MKRGPPARKKTNEAGETPALSTPVIPAPPAPSFPRKRESSA